MNEIPLLEDQDGAPYPEQVQDLYRNYLALTAAVRELAAMAARTVADWLDDRADAQISEEKS